MIYGATGFTGRLILAAALRAGMRPVVAGRNEERVKALAGEHQLPFAVFALDAPEAAAAALEDVDLVLNAAGPFRNTALPLVDACLGAKVHYLDICCELDVLEALARRGPEAAEACVLLLPGAGFHCALADGLGAHLQRRLPQAVRLVIALSQLAPPSRGLTAAGLRLLGAPGKARRRGRLVKTRRRRIRGFDFGRGPVRCFALGWGELATLHRTTGVRNIDFYVQRRRDLTRLVQMNSLAALALGLPPFRGRVRRWLGAQPEGPDEGWLRRGRAHMLGIAYDPGGQRAMTRLHTPDPFSFTAAFAVALLGELERMPLHFGFHTPAGLLGPDFLARMPGLGIDWEELDLSAPGELDVRIVRRPGLIGLLKSAPRRGRKAEAPAGAASEPLDPTGAAEKPLTLREKVAEKAGGPNPPESDSVRETEETAEESGGASKQDPAPQPRKVRTG